MTAVTHNNSVARQRLNTQYQHQTGAGVMEEVINGFGRGSWVFIGLSIAVSTFSVYHDFVTSLGAVMAFTIAFILAIAIEYFRHNAIKAFFNMTGVSKIIVGTVAVMLFIGAVYTHYRSLGVYETIIVNNALSAKNQELAYQRGMTNENIKVLVASNLEVSKGINNGTASDDSDVKDITKSNNELIQTMIVLNGKSNIHQTELTLSSANKTARLTKETLLFLFAIIEFLAVFSILSKLLLSLNTDSNVKALASLMDKSNEMQDNVFQALGDTILGNAHTAIEQAMGAIPQQAKPIMEEVQPDEPKLISPTFKRRVEPQPQEAELMDETHIEIETINTKIKAIDWSAFSEQEGVLIKIMWNNGSIKVGEYLIDRDTIIKEASENFGIKRAGSILTNLYDNLKTDHKMIERPQPHKGYIAKVALKKELWTEKEA